MRALANASIAVTSQAAEKVYRALNEPAQIKTELKASAAAKLARLPQETIMFNGGRLRRDTEIELSSGAELLALEWLVLGRAAHGEKMAGGQITETWRVKKDCKLIWADSFRVTDETLPHLHRKALLSNCKALATQSDRRSFTTADWFVRILSEVGCSSMSGNKMTLLPPRGLPQITSPPKPDSPPRKPNVRNRANA